MSISDIRFLTLKQMTSAIKFDNLEKFKKYAEIKIEVQRETEEGDFTLRKEIQPEVVFHRCDIDRLYLIHHILINKAVKIMASRYKCVCWCVCVISVYGPSSNPAIAEFMEILVTLIFW